MNFAFEEWIAVASGSVSSILSKRATGEAKFLSRYASYSSECLGTDRSDRQTCPH